MLWAMARNRRPSEGQTSPPAFNPLATEALAESIGVMFLRRPATPMPPTDVPAGAGVYAIYYTGNAQPYGDLGRHNQREAIQIPVYVGKATLKGVRIGMTAQEIGFRLRDRLANHARRLTEANFDLSDFRCRHLVIDPVWVPLGESLLIGLFEPVWNVVVQGFGNNPVGAGRTAQRRSAWDTLHPGRQWSSRLPVGSANQVQQIRNQIRQHIEDVLHRYPAMRQRFSGPSRT